MTYDILGRIKTKTSPEEGLTEYQYDSKTYGKGLLASVSNDIAGTSVEYTYNQYGQPTVVKETIDELPFTTKYDYNIYGAVTKITYPSNSTSSTPFSVTQHYNSRGYLTEVTNSADGASIWKLDAINTRGQLTNYTLGNGIEIIKTFDNYGYLEENISDDDVTIDQKYSFDHVTGNMNWRKNLPLYYWEIFTYDNSNRLTKSLFGNGDEKNIDYKPNSNGNIDFKTDIGNYFYTGTQPHAVTQVSNTAGLISENLQDIVYNSFNKVSKITEDLNTLDLVYGIDNERRKTVYKENGTTTILTKYYSTNYEKQITATNTRELHYIFAGDGLCAVYEKNTPNGSTTSSSNMYYTHKDYLGSITEITNKDGVLLQRMHYDAWGKRTLEYNNSVFSDFILDRGYTGHEHLEQFNLINMNGRLYDPMLGRMLSPDNYVQSATYSQSFNRYSYALNNPMKYTDPSGDFLASGFFGIAFLGEFLSNGINGYGWSAKTAYNSANTTTSNISNLGQFPISQSGNTTVTAGLDPFNFGVSVNAYHTEGDWTLSGSAGVGFVSFGYAGGGISYSKGDLTIGIGGGYSAGGLNPNGTRYTGGYSASGGITYSFNENQSLGYYATYYGGAQSQWTGGLRYANGDFSLRIENDMFAFQRQDRWRTSAVEIGIGNFLIGTNIYTNDPYNEGEGYNLNGTNLRGKMNRTAHNPENQNGAWNNGRVYSSPLYIGFKSGNTVSRIGWSDPWIQDRTQNFIHKNFPPGYQHFYNNYNYFNHGIYGYYGYNNQYSLY